jgi:hypothetical protein
MGILNFQKCDVKYADLQKIFRKFRPARPGEHASCV